MRKEERTQIVIHDDGKMQRTKRYLNPEELKFVGRLFHEEHYLTQETKYYEFHFYRKVSE